MTVILLRHGRSTANTAATLAGRSPGVGLDATGRQQAAGAAARLRGLPIRALVSSPQQRCRETLAPVAGELGLDPLVDDALAEVDYGDWTGRPLAELVKEPLWRIVQQQPSAAVFPGGEGLAAVQARAVGAVRARDALLRRDDGGDTLWVACTHGDVIKSILADALGMHLDGFQRIATVPAAVSVISYTDARPVVQHLNDTGSVLDRIAPRGEDPADADGADRAHGGAGGGRDPAQQASAMSGGVPGGEI